MSKEYEYDFFICHASEDKDEFVRPLAEELTTKGFKVWYDEFELTLGDSLRQTIDRGLASSRFGIVVLSRAFFSKDWPQKELDGLDALEVNGRKVILPIWHDVDKEYITRYSPTLAGKYAKSTSKGLDQVISAIEAAFQKGSTAEPDSPASTSMRVDRGIGDELILTGFLEGQDLENRVFDECTRNGSATILRSLERGFKAVKRFLVDQRDLSGILGDSIQDELSTEPEKTVSRVAWNAFAIRVGLASAGESSLEREIGEDLFDLHLALFHWKGSNASILGMKTEVGSSAYACGAYGIMKNLPELARSLLGRSNPTDVQGSRQWFRQLQIDSGWGPGEMLRHVLLKWRGAEYFLDLCGEEDKALGFLCQFDFLQCAQTLAIGRHMTECYPSFCAFRRSRVQPIVETLIDTMSDGVWIPPVSDTQLAKIIHDLGEFASDCAGFERPQWKKGPWSSHKIQMLLANYESEVR